MGEVLSRLSRRTRHFFHLVSNIRPIVWIGLYILLTPLFAAIYWALPDGQFRIPDGASTDFGGWLYYSIVTITTLGFGDYTPTHGWAQMVTAIEVMCGLIILGLFLNAVGSMKSEIDVESEIEKQRQLHYSGEHDKLLKSIPSVLHVINQFLAYCYVVTTPASRRHDSDASYNPKFVFSDMVDLFKPSGLSSDGTSLPSAERLVKSAGRVSLCLDSLQTRVDLTLWPELLEYSFAFVAGYQMFSSSEAFSHHVSLLIPRESGKGTNAEAALSEMISGIKGVSEAKKERSMEPVVELYYFIKENADIARKLEVTLTKLSSGV